jgi:hypothetical protein
MVSIHLRDERGEFHISRGSAQQLDVRQRYRDSIELACPLDRGERVRDG